MEKTEKTALPQESRQSVMKTLGEYGCYFLSLVRLSEKIRGKRIDAVAAFVIALERKWADKDATMLDPAAILSAMSGKRFTVRKEDAGYKAAPNEYEVLLFTNGSYSHFVLGDGNGNVEYDPLGKSRSVAEGKITGKRIFALA